MSQLNLVMIARNEEKVIERCLSSVRPYVNDLIVVDTGSTDKTAEIAKQCGARVYNFKWSGHFAEARNFALSQSSSAWNLVLDADEYIDSIDIKALGHFMANYSGTKTVGRIEVISETRQNGEINIAKDYVPRILPAGVQYSGRIHEQIDAFYKRINIPVSVLHDGYLKGSKGERNIPLLLRELQDQPHHPYYLFQLAKEFKGLGEVTEACSYFEKAYTRLTGRERYAPNVVVEYIYALMDLKQWDRAYELIELKHSWLSGYPDFHFVRGLVLLDWIMIDPEHRISRLPDIESAYKRCLEIGETDRYDSVKGTGSYAALYNLGVYYEVLGKTEDALHCFKRSAQTGYDKAIQHLG